MAEPIVEQVLALAPAILRLGAPQMSVDLDAEADVLYVSLRPGAKADDGELTDDNIIIRYDEKGEIIGITILDASRFLNPSASSAPLSVLRGETERR